MKDWPADHPKAKLMASKRAAILDAAREAFLRDGYEGSSMEGIAAAAGVSIMTLYRHAASKEELFIGVVTHLCDFPVEQRDARFAETIGLPLAEVLAGVGTVFQNKLVSPQTIALMRTVIAEATRFPQLAETAYQSFIGEYKDNVNLYLSLRPELSGLRQARRKQLSHAMIDSLVGVSILRALLGLEPSSGKEHAGRAKAAAQKLLDDADHFMSMRP
jgi:TetR/AcrR family transcriptional repressor of mexJK operon